MRPAQVSYFTYDGHLDLNDETSVRTRLVKRVPPRATVLELGCSTGYMTRYLTHSRGCAVTCVEIDPAVASMARQVAAEMIEGDLEDPSTLARIKRKYDIILCSDVLEHLREPWSLLPQLAHFVAPGGKLLISVPNIANIGIRKRLLLGRFDYTVGGILDRGHLRHFTWRTSRQMITDAGFAILDAEVVCLLPRLLATPLRATCRPLEAMVRDRVGQALPGLFGFQFVFVAAPKDGAGQENQIPLAVPVGGD